MPFDLTDAVGLSADVIGDSPERTELRSVIRKLVAKEAPPWRTAELDEKEEFDLALHRRLGDFGAFALGGDPDHSGSGDGRDQLVVIEELASGPTAMAVFAIVHYMAVQILSSFGSPEQREHYLPPLLAGDIRMSFALTEADGGTDIAHVMRTRAEPTGGGWMLSGRKTWISGALGADYLLVLARTSQAADSPLDGITMFLVPRRSPGVEIRELPTMAVHGLDTCEIVLDTRVGPDAVIGQIGRGFRDVLGTLNRERLNTAAAALGAGRGALEATVRYANERRAFGRSIGSMQAVQHRMVDGALALESARSLMVRAAAVEAAGGRADILSSMAKLAASEAAVKITQDGMSAFGGAGFSREFPMQRWFRDVRLWTFAPLNNDMVRNYLGQRYLGLERSY